MKSYHKSVLDLSIAGYSDEPLHNLADNAYKRERAVVFVCNCLTSMKFLLSFNCTYFDKSKRLHILLRQR